MNYEQASAIGDVGERRVAEVLRAEAPSLGYELLNNLLLIDDQTTAQLDHVLVDRFGIVVIETKNYHALIKGRSDDKFWTACYSGNQRRRDRFLNPLRQNDRHREMLHRVLGACGRSLDVNYVQSLVIFAGGNLAHLGLDDADSMRVIPNREVVDYLRARCGDFQPNPGILDAEKVADLVSLLQSVNMADNPDVVALHAESVNRATRRFGGRFRRRPAGRVSAPPSQYGGYRTYNQSSRYPDGSQHVPTRRRSGFEGLVRELLGALFVVALGWWILFGGGIALFEPIGRYLTSVTTKAMMANVPETAEAPAQPAASTGGYDVGLALQRLNEASPRTYGKLVNASSPQLSSTRGMSTYTWQYTQKSAQNAVVICTIAITLDSGGRIVGVTDAK